MKNKHLSYDERLNIEKGLKENKSFKEIANIVNKNCTTISREIRNHYVVEKIVTFKLALIILKKNVSYYKRHLMYAMVVRTDNRVH